MSLSLEEEQMVKEQYKISRTTWIALMVSVVLYVFVVIYAAPGRSGENQMPLLEIMFGGMSFLFIVAAVVLKRFYLSTERKAPGLDKGPVKAANRRYGVAVIVQLAMGETVALYGLVVVFINGNAAYFYGMTAASLTLMALLFRPSLAELTAYVEAQKKLAPPDANDAFRPSPSPYPY